MDFKNGEIVEIKDATFAKNVPNLRGIVHSMPGLNGDHWFAPDQLQVPPFEPVVDSTSVSDSTVHSDDSNPTWTLHLRVQSLMSPPGQLTIPSSFLKIIQLQSKRTRTQIDKFTYPMTYIQSRANHKSRRSQVNSIRMVHHAARGHALSAQYDAAVQDPIIATSMRTELVDLLIPQDDNQGSKVSIVRPPARAHNSFVIPEHGSSRLRYLYEGLRLPDGYVLKLHLMIFTIIKLTNYSPNTAFHLTQLSPVSILSGYLTTCSYLLVSMLMTFVSLVIHKTRLIS